MAFSTVAAIAGAAASVGGAVMQAQASRTQAKAQAAINERNARIQEQEAKMQERAGLDAAERSQQETRRAIAAAKVGYAKGGVTSAGSPLLLEIDAEQQGALEALTLRQNAAFASSRSLGGASISRLAGQSALRAGRTSSAASLLGGASQLAGQYYNYKLNR